jgi:lipopolysaccharide transport system ATP-binding protein
VASLLEVGTGFHPELTGRENIYLNGAILGMSRSEIKRHFDAIVDFAETEKFLDTPVKRYSSGMYVRLAFAIAAHLEPEILIVDEVLAVGDAEFQKKCLGKMEDVSKNEGRTILFVSHNISAVRKLTEKVVYLKNGTMQASGPSAEMIERYLGETISHINEGKGTELYRRADRNPIATIRNITINNTNTEFPRIGMKAAINCIFAIDAEQNITDPSMNIVIKNIDGDIITTIASRDTCKVKDLAKGSNSIAFTIADNCFVPGKYFATIGLSPSSGGLSYDVLTDYPLFEIYNDGKIVYWLERDFGNFIMNRISWL